MIEQLVEPQTAKLAKEKGFNEYCRCTYRFSERGPDYWRPSQEQLERWLRETHGLIAYACPCFSAHGYADKWEATLKSKTTVIVHAGGQQYTYYEQAREEALRMGLMLVP